MKICKADSSDDTVWVQHCETVLTGTKMCVCLCMLIRMNAIKASFWRMQEEPFIFVLLLFVFLTFSLSAAFEVIELFSPVKPSSMSNFRLEEEKHSFILQISFSAEHRALSGFKDSFSVFRLLYIITFIRIVSIPSGAVTL